MNSHTSDMAPKRVVVVGDGILGTMHALFAVRSGATVIHLDRARVLRDWRYDSI